MDDLLDDVVDKLAETSGIECSECGKKNMEGRDTCVECGTVFE
jgi:uncharacterized OB-fold protein